MFQVITNNEKMKKDLITSNNTASKDWGITDLLTKIKRVVNELEIKNYIVKFRRDSTCINSDELHQCIMPEDFTIDETYHFETMSNPDTNRILYAISLPQGTKGFLIDSRDVYTDNISPEMMQKLESYKNGSNGDHFSCVDKIY